MTKLVRGSFCILFVYTRSIDVTRIKIKNSRSLYLFFLPMTNLQRVFLAGGIALVFLFSVSSILQGGQAPILRGNLLSAQICQPVPETCNNQDDDCDNLIDENNVCGTPASCGNGSCEFSNNETSASCPADCKEFTVDPTNGEVGTVARLYSTVVFDGGEKFFIDSQGVETHVGPYPGGRPLTTNGHGEPMSIPGPAAGPGRIELRSANGPGVNIVESYLPFFVDPSNQELCGNLKCDPGEDSLNCPMDCGNSTTGCGDGICDEETENPMTCKLDCGSPARCEEPDCDRVCGVWDESYPELAEQCRLQCQTGDAAGACQNALQDCKGGGNICMDNDRDGYVSGPDCIIGAPLDCDDNDPQIYPQASEKCDGRDNNCDQRVDENNVCGGPVTCPDGRKDLNGFSGDGCEYICPIWPTSPESCNNYDDNCDGLVDENNVCGGGSGGCTSHSQCPPTQPYCHFSTGVCASTPINDCGDGICATGESSENCPIDCVKKSSWFNDNSSSYSAQIVTCGDNKCDPAAGENSANCPADCTSGSLCGNAMCEPGENSTSCPSDCAQSSPCVVGSQCTLNSDCGNTNGIAIGNCDRGACLCPSACGDGICSPSETATSCSSDCQQSGNDCDQLGQSCMNQIPGIGSSCPQCGDGVCGTTETVDNCSWDCRVVDTDGDGVNDSRDLCPDTPPGEEVDVNGCSDSQVDADGDGACNHSAPSFGPRGCSGSDQCETIPGRRDYQGCPVGDKNVVEFHTVNIGGAESTKVPLPGVEVRVYDRNNVDFQTIAGSKNPNGSLYGIIFEADAGKVGSCTTDAAGICIAGEAKLGDYLVIVKYFDTSTGKTVYVGRPKSPSDFVDTDGNNTPDLATKEFQVIKVFKKGIFQEYRGGSKIVVTGSMLEIIAPESAIWEGTQSIYPFIFTSDSDWSVDVCAQVATGYRISGVYDENGNLADSGSCIQSFVNGGTKVVAFEVTDVGSPEPSFIGTLNIKHKGKNTVKKVSVSDIRRKAFDEKTKEAKNKSKAMIRDVLAADLTTSISSRPYRMNRGDQILPMVVVGVLVFLGALYLMRNNDRKKSKKRR